MATRTLGKKKKFKFKWTIELFVLIGFFLIFIITDIILTLPSERDAVTNVWKTDVSARTDIKKISEDALLNKIKNAKEDDLLFVFYATPADINSPSEMRRVDPLLAKYNATIENLDKTLPKATVYWLDSRTYYNYKDKENSTSYHNLLKEKYEAFGGLDFDKTTQVVVYKAGKLIKKGEEITYPDLLDKYLQEYILNITKKSE